MRFAVVAVAGGRVVGAEQWVAGDARRAEPAEPPPLARTLATAAAAAIRGDLVGVDLLPTSSGYVVLDLNPAADLGLEHAGACADVVAALLRTPAERRAAVALGA